MKHFGLGRTARSGPASSHPVSLDELIKLLTYLASRFRTLQSNLIARQTIMPRGLAPGVSDNLDRLSRNAELIVYEANQRGGPVNLLAYQALVNAAHCAMCSVDKHLLR